MRILSGLVLLALAIPGWGATGDILAVRIASATAHNGWIAEIDIDSLGTGGTYNFGLADSGYSRRNDPAGAKIVFTVTSPGYTTTGTTTSIQRTVYGVWWMRKAYPNQSQADESVAGSTLTVRVVLSDYIYSGDTATVNIASGFYTQGGTPNNAATGMSVTVNSTQSYPKSVCRWATVPYQRVTGDFVVEAVCFHRHFQSYRPLAAVKFTCQDEAAPTPNSATVTVNWMLPSPNSSQYGDRQTVLTYAATIPVSGLNQGDVLTCNFIAYPWVGNSGALVDTSSGASDNEALGPLLLLNDKNGTYGGAFAVIDPVNGNNSTATTWVYATQSAAESAYASSSANSYTTIGNAVQAIQSYNNANYSRNNPGGGVVLLTGNHTYPGTVPPTALNAQETWFTITRLSSVAKSSAVINSLSVSNNLKAPLTRIYDISITATGSGSQLRGTAGVDQLWADSLSINLSSSAGIEIWKRAFGTGNTVAALTGGFTHFSTNKSPWALLRGNEFTGTTNLNGALYASFGNKKIFPYNYERGNAPGHLFSDNGIFAFNSIFKATAPLGAWDSCSGNPDQVIGWALVQNVWEREPLDSQPLLTVAQSDSCDTTNILLWYNTFVGQRENLGYNSTGSTPYYRWLWSMVGNIYEDWNNKGDQFPTEDSNRVGGWPIEHNVGSAGNTYAYAGFPPSFDGLYSNDWPVMVDGTDSLPYVSIAKHTAATDNRPITGGSYATYWTQRGSASSNKSQAWASGAVYGPQAFADDQTDGSGGGAGGGKYWMVPATGLRANGIGLGLLPPAYRPLPYDLAGRPRTNGAAGAYDLAPAGRAQ
ncbi:MAG TPA: hypothetical protein VNN17_05770 [Terriglobia bacterium]|nr:hypothetical protein [Terriglobia bacterium]